MTIKDAIRRARMLVLRRGGGVVTIHRYDCSIVDSFCDCRPRIQIVRPRTGWFR